MKRRLHYFYRTEQPYFLENGRFNECFTVERSLMKVSFKSVWHFFPETVITTTLYVTQALKPVARTMGARKLLQFDCCTAIYTPPPQRQLCTH